MPAIKAFDGSDHKALRAALATALAPVEEASGIQFVVTRIEHETTSFSGNITAVSLTGTSEPAKREATPPRPAIPSVWPKPPAPHPSHEMSEWEDTIVTIISTPRFGRIRTCQSCGGEQAETVAGKAMNEELKRPCPFVGEAS